MLPHDSIVVSAATVAVFLIFASVMIWTDFPVTAETSQFLIMCIFGAPRRALLHPRFLFGRATPSEFDFDQIIRGEIRPDRADAASKRIVT
jgi:hypothetical protein